MDFSRNQDISSQFPPGSKEIFNRLRQRQNKSSDVSFGSLLLQFQDSIFFIIICAFYRTLKQSFSTRIMSSPLKIFYSALDFTNLTIKNRIVSSVMSQRRKVQIQYSTIYFEGLEQTFHLSRATLKISLVMQCRGAILTPQNHL